MLTLGIGAVEEALVEVLLQPLLLRQAEGVGRVLAGKFVEKFGCSSVVVKSRDELSDV